MKTLSEKRIELPVEIACRFNTEIFQLPFGDVKEAIKETQKELIKESFCKHRVYDYSNWCFGCFIKKTFKKRFGEELTKDEVKK